MSNPFNCHFRLPLLMLGLLLQATCLAQPNTFIESYSINSEFGDIGKSLGCVDSSLVLIAGSVVQLPQQERYEDQIVKLSPYGEVVWSVILLEEGRRYVGSFKEGLVAKNDSVWTTTTIRDGRRSGELGLVTTLLETGETRYAGRLDDSTKYFAGDLLFAPDSSGLIDISTRDLGIDEYFPMTVTKLSLVGEVIMMENYFDHYRKFVFRSSRIDSIGNLCIVYKGCVAEGNCNGNQAWITKIDPAGEILWTKNYGETAGNQNVEPYLSLLSEDRMALSWTRDTGDLTLQESPPIIYILDREGEKLDSIAFHGNWRTLSRIQTAANGDIIGAGYAWTDIGYCGWMIRVTPEAELVWERYIQDNRLADDVYTELRDVAECSDGSVAAGGLWTCRDAPRDGGNTLRSWVVKLDADGCLEPGCTSDTIHLMKPVAIEEVERRPVAEINISPNPVNDVLHLELAQVDLAVSQLKYTIANSDGRILQSGPVTGASMDVEVGRLPAGLHFFSVTDVSRLLGVRRFFKR